MPTGFERGSTSVSTPPEKSCATCGRRITWRAKWRDCWDEITQSGHTVDPSTAKGPIRLRKPI